MTIQKSLSPATNHSLKDIDFYKNFTNNMSTASTGKMEGLSPSHDQTDASALAAAAAAAHAHLNGTMQDMINLQKLQNLATLQHQHNQQQQQQQQQHNQQQSDSPVAVPPVAAALASLQGLAGISSAVALNSPLNLSIGSTTSAATAVANLSSSTGPTNSINNNKPHGPLGSTSTSSSSPLPVSSLSISITGSTATSPPHGGDTIARVGNSPVASNLIAGGCSPPAASAQMPQLILASGQLVQGVQGAQLLIPTAQGIAVQTILTIPVSQQINTNEQFGKFATPLPPPPQSQSLLKPNLFSNGVQQLLAALHPELFAAAAANHLANAADAHHHHQHAAVAAAAAAAKSFHMQQIKQEQQRDQQSQAHRASQQFQHLHHQHQQLQSTDNHHLSPKLEATTINSRHSPSPPLHQFNSSSPCGRSPSMSPQPPAGSSQANMPLHLKQSPNRDCSAGINLSHQQQTAKSPVSPALMALSSGGNGNNCPSASNHYSSSPMSSHLFRSHSPAGSQHLTSMSTPSPSNIQHQSREQQQREHQIASASSVLSSINRLTSTNGELTITKSHGPSTTQSSSLSPPHHQSSSLTSQSQSQHHQQQPNSHHPLHSGGVGGHHPHLHSGGNSLKMSPSSSSSVGMQQQQQISPNGTDGSGTDLLVDSPHEQTINQATSNVVDGIDLDEIKEFAKAFKLRRLSLGLTQTQVGQALSVTEGPAYSQSAICSALAAQMYAAQLSSQQQNMFEKLDITPKSAQKIKPVLERWMKEAEESHWNRYKTGQNHLTDYIGVEPSKKRKRRTSFTPQALELLNAHFERNTHPSGTEITGLAHQLGYEREVIRIWFCNKRQALKNTVRMMSKGMV